MKALLTDVGLRALELAPKQYKVWDERTKSFGVLVSSSTKTFFVSYGRARNIKTLGRYQDVSLAEARKLAMGVLSADQPEPTSKIKFKEAIEEFIEKNYKSSKGRHKDNTKRLLTTHFLPEFATKPVASLTDKQIGDELAKIADRPSEQLHAFRAIRTILKWCTKPPHRYLTHSPLVGYTPPGKDKKRQAYPFRYQAGEGVAGLRGLLRWPCATPHSLGNVT